MIGQVLGHYRIDSKLGEGGMGVVYRAFDTHLDRPVAIKVLRADATASPERKRRFVQEAKSASALNHPNIIHIYDISTAELPQGATDFIAMEFVPGKTLDQHIGKNGLALRDTLKYATQIADALARAHAAGIIHRDLKPANIIVADDGRVKLLDFGLAKLTEKIDDDPEGATATMTAQESPQTEEGTIVGTVAYMSPEQAEGKKVDARSDIFSFGSVLYEMVTGHRPFEGATKISTLSAILHKEPKSAGEIAPNIPAELEKIISRCLRKDAGRRTQHMDDVKLALEDLKEESESGRLPAHTQLAASPSRRSRFLAGITAGIVTLALASALVWRLADSRSPRPFNPVLTRLTNDAGLSTDPALSPDGKLVAYASDRASDGNLDLWVQQVGGGGAVRLTSDPADEHEPAFSPDGTRIAFRSERGGGGIHLIPALGGIEPRLVVEGGRHPRFSPDGALIAYSIIPATSSVMLPGSSHIHVVSADGTAARAIQAGFSSADHPIWLPDGRHILFVGRRDSASPNDVALDWWVAPLDGGPAIQTGAYEILRRSGIATTDLYWPPSPDDCIDDRVIFTARQGDSTNLWQVRLSPATRKVEGVPTRLTFGTGQETGPRAGGLAGARVVVFSSMLQRHHVWRLGINANQATVTPPIQAVTQGAGNEGRPSTSSDGSRIAYLANFDSEVWLHDLASGKATIVSATPGHKSSPIMSPDGTRVAYVAEENGKQCGFLASFSGGVAGRPKKAVEECDAFTDWVGNGLVYQRGRPSSIAFLDLDSGLSRDLLRHPQYPLSRAHCSLDGRWVAFRAQLATDRMRIFVAPVHTAAPTPEDEWIPIYDGGGSDRPAAAWSPDGSLIYLLLDRDGFRCLWAQRLDPTTKHVIGEPVAVNHWHGFRRGFPSTGWGHSIGGGHFIFDQVDATGNLWLTRLE